MRRRARMIDLRRAAMIAAIAGIPSLGQGLAQAPAELLQKGIYMQEAAGDVDGAVQIYRQITASAAPQSQLAAQAQFRIAEILLQKGDLQGAATEFSVL